MCDVFTRAEAQSALRGKSILLMGDSIMRNLYKDLLYVLSPLTDGGLIPRQHMVAKGETSFLGDRLTNCSAEATAGRDYREERDYYMPEHDLQVSFKFITRCFDGKLAHDLRCHPELYGSFPDLIMVNSALWDINRWGPRGVDHFKENIKRLMELFRELLPRRTQVIWMTTPPIATEIRCGILIKQLEFMQRSMRFNIMEGNQFAATVTAAYGYDVLDMHYYFTNQIHRRSPDGVHWNPDAVRMQVNIFLTHYCLSRRLELPDNWRIDPPFGTNLPLQRAQELADKAKESVPEEDTGTGCRRRLRAKRSRR